MNKIKTFTGRTVHAAKVKVGKADETVDIQMNQEVSKFKNHYKHMKKINDDTKKVQKVMKELAKAMAELTEDIHAMFDSNDNAYQASVQMQYCNQDVDAARLALEEQWRDDFQAPLSEYIGQFAEMDKRVSIRDKRRVDMDRYRDEVKTLTEKSTPNQAKLSSTKEKLAVMQESYKELNSELLVDIPALYSDRSKFFTPMMATLCDAYMRYYAACDKSFQQLGPHIRNIDRSEAHRHPRVITDNEISTAYREVYTGAGGFSSNASVATARSGGPTSVGGYQNNSPTPGYYSQPPPQQGGYPPQQGGYPPQQGGYPPQQGGYPPQQGGYPPQQGGYPPQQPTPGGFASPPPAHGGYPPQHSPQPNAYQQAPGQYAPTPVAAPPPVAPPRSGPPPAAGNRVIRAKALYPFDGQDASELSFKFNDIINIRKQMGEWWEGELNGRVGLLPANYVEIIDK